MRSCKSGCRVYGEAVLTYRCAASFFFAQVSKIAFLLTMGQTYFIIGLSHCPVGVCEAFTQKSKNWSTLAKG